MKQILQGRAGKIEADVKRKDDSIEVKVGDKAYSFSLLSNELSSYLLSNETQIYRCVAIRNQDDYHFHVNGKAFSFREISEEIAASSDSHSGDLRVIAPMPGTIIKLLVSEGECVKKGQPLVIVEAMKMENEVRAAGDAVVEKVLTAPGERVGFGQELIKLAPPQEDGGQTKPS